MDLFPNPAVITPFRAPSTPDRNVQQDPGTGDIASDWLKIAETRRARGKIEAVYEMYNAESRAQSIREVIEYIETLMGCRADGLCPVWGHPH